MRGERCPVGVVEHPRLRGDVHGCGEPGSHAAPGGWRHAGTAGCPSGETAEEWCADFAAWAWQMAGVDFTYGYGTDEVNGAAASFYEWGVANGAWHPATSGYVAAPGDVAVYGLSLGATPSAVRVAIVTGDAPGQPGPDVVNGDGDRTGFSVVEKGTDQALADAGNGDSALSGYVSPPLPSET